MAGQMILSLPTISPASATRRLNLDENDFAAVQDTSVTTIDVHSNDLLLTGSVLTDINYSREQSLVGWSQVMPG
jgi:hypothetical protein